MSDCQVPTSSHPAQLVFNHSFHRAEIEAGELALEQVSASLSEARVKQHDAESKLKEAQQALAEKEAMINFVNEEVDRVKGKRSRESAVFF